MTVTDNTPGGAGGTIDPGRRQDRTGAKLPQDDALTAIHERAARDARPEPAIHDATS